MHFILSTWLHELFPHVPNWVQLSLSTFLSLPSPLMFNEKFSRSFDKRYFSFLRVMQDSILNNFGKLEERPHRSICHGTHKDVHCLMLDGPAKGMWCWCCGPTPSFLTAVISMIFITYTSAPSNPNAPLNEPTTSRSVWKREVHIHFKP